MLKFEIEEPCALPSASDQYVPAPSKPTKLVRRVKNGTTLKRRPRREEPTEHICQWKSCGEEFPDIPNLVIHVHSEIDKRKLKCTRQRKWTCLWTDCDRKKKPFRARYQLETHMRCHTFERPYSCTVEGCPKRFMRRENRESHIRTHFGDKPFQCHYPGCTKGFANASDRAKHQTRTHTEGNPFVCRVIDCDKAYTDPSSLRKHYNEIHGEDVYELARSLKTIEQDNGGELRYVYEPRGSVPEPPRVVTFEEAKELVPSVQLEEKRSELELFASRQQALADIIKVEKERRRQEMPKKPRKSAKRSSTTRKPRHKTESEHDADMEVDYESQDSQDSDSTDMDNAIETTNYPAFDEGNYVDLDMYYVDVAPVQHKSFWAYKLPEEVYDNGMWDVDFITNSPDFTDWKDPFDPPSSAYKPGVLLPI